jgi:hypothetical protein
MKNIFLPLRDYNLDSATDFPFHLIRLRYDLSRLKENPDYNEAKLHWKQDIGVDTIDPEDLEQEVKLLNNDIDDFFTNKVPKYVRKLDWTPFSLSEETANIPPLNHVSIQGMISRIVIDWVYGGPTNEHYDDVTRCYLLEERIIATIDPNLTNALRGRIDILRNHYEIRAMVQNFKDRREKLCREAEKLSNEINTKIIFPIERKQYRTQCKNCNDKSISS